MNIQDVRLAVVGLGYVGLPLAVEFGKHRDVLGFDINTRRIEELRAGRDHTLEVDGPELAQAAQLRYSADPAELAAANVFIVTVPTPRPKEGSSSQRGRRQVTRRMYSQI